MPKKYPPLTSREVISILKARGFTYIRASGSHEHYEGTIKNKRRVVTIDLHYDQFSDKLIKYMIAQSGLTRDEFYGSTKRTAKKINLSSKVYPIPLKRG